MFNVPYGRQAHTTFLQPGALMGAHRALAGVEVVCEDFEACARYVRARDFVYFDPPYVDGLRKAPAFSAYQAGGFDEEAQRRLAALVRRLDERGALVMVSQSDSPLIRSSTGACGSIRCWCTVKSAAMWQDAAGPRGRVRN